MIVVSSVSCIYGIGSKESYSEMMISLRPGMIKDRDEVIDDLINIQYVRSELDFKRGTFRVKGDVLEILPVSTFEDAVRVEFFGDEIDRIVEFDVLTGEVKRSLNFVAIFPASHYVVPQEQIERAIKGIKEELAEQVAYFKEHDQLIEAQRIAERTNFDIEMLRETGFCSGIENYSRHLAGLEPGQPPSTLIDFFGDDFLMIIDESHITVPQIGGMYAGDQSRKSTLVDFGFRLPSAKDNRPLEFSEFEQKIDQMLFVSATPGKYEEEHELLRAEQIIRPTGLLDPAIDVRPVEGQIDDLLGEIHKETDKGNKVLVTTLTKRMAEELTDYMREVGIRVKYLHSDIDTLERIEIVRDLRIVRLRSVSVIAACIESVMLSAYMITCPSLFLAARPIVCTREVSERKNPSLSASRIATNVISGISNPSLNKLIPTNTSKTPILKSLTISILSNLSISE